MAKQLESTTLQVVLFVEGETDEVFFKALIDYYRTVSTSELHPCRICNLRGVTRYSSKLLAKLKNEFSASEGVIKLYNNQVFVADNIKELYETRTRTFLNLWKRL